MGIDQARPYRWRGGQWLRGVGAHRLHQVLTGVHGADGVAGTVQAVTDAVVAFTGFGVAAVSVLRSGGILETVAVAGSREAASHLLGVSTPQWVYEEEFAVAQRWGSLLFVAHQHLPDAGQRGWIPPLASRPRRVGRRARRWHELDALYARLCSLTGEFVGVLSVDLPVGGIRPGRQQRELLEILAAQAGIAIDNARLAERLQTSERLFRWTFDGAGTGMAVISLAPENFGRYLRVNESFSRIVGRSEAQILQMTCRELTHPQDRAADERHLQELAAGATQSYQRDKRYLTGDGGAVWVANTVASSGPPGVAAEQAIGHVLDITERRARQLALEHQAHHDPLTGLAHRTALISRLRQATVTAQQTGRPGAVLFIDLDGFKAVNDQRGHLVGDQALIVVAARLSEEVGPADLVARIGGDEFVVVADNTTTSEADDLAGRLAAAVQVGITGPGETLLHLTASIGHAPIMPDQPGTPEELIAAADEAMYTTKRTKRTPRPT